MGFPEALDQAGQVGEAGGGVSEESGLLYLIWAFRVCLRTEGPDRFFQRVGDNQDGITPVLITTSQVMAAHYATRWSDLYARVPPTELEQVFGTGFEVEGSSHPALVIEQDLEGLRKKPCQSEDINDPLRFALRWTPDPHARYTFGHSLMECYVPTPYEVMAVVMSEPRWNEEDIDL